MLASHSTARKSAGSARVAAYTWVGSGAASSMPNWSAPEWVSVDRLVLSRYVPLGSSTSVASPLAFGEAGSGG